MGAINVWRVLSEIIYIDFQVIRGLGWFTHSRCLAGAPFGSGLGGTANMGCTT